jgi:hypothetical protein
LNHPDVHTPWQQWSEAQTLHVAAAYSNPFRWRTRRELANDFKRHMRASPNVALHFGELAYGDRPHEVTGIFPQPPAEESGWGDMPKARPTPYSLDVQLRTGAELFHKENILNRVIQTFPPDWQYGMICDADFHFTRHDWALETIHQLQHYAFVQPFSSYVDVTGGTYGMAQMPTRANTGFFFNYVNNGFQVSPQYHNGTIPGPPETYEGAMIEGRFMRGVGATGGALAFTRAAFNAVGRLLDRCILGHADWYMAFGLVGLDAPDIHTQKYSPDYVSYVNTWKQRAAAIQRNVGYTDGMAIHFFHGSKTRRAYSSRDKILATHQFSPYRDIWEDAQGIYQLTPDKPALRDDIRAHFCSRSEDDPNLYAPERLMV